MAQGSVPLVSVIVPVYNDARRLARCLAALRAQTWPADRLEVIVVDNGSGDAVETALVELPTATLLREPRPGSYAARNRGIEASKGTILAFTDADCVPAPDWIERGVALLEATPEVGMVGGRIDLRFADPARPTAVELFDRLYGFPQERFVRRDGFSVTANLFTRRTVMAAVGAFDASLRSGGDREWGERAVRAGFRIVYADDVVVGHPARRRLAELSARSVRLAGGHVEQTRRRSARSRQALVGELLWSLRPPVSAIPLVLRDPRLDGVSPGLRLQLLGVIAWNRYRTALERLRLILGGEPAR
jgi:glycosyltransferase involved in cell wall biosynthesis